MKKLQKLESLDLKIDYLALNFPTQKMEEIKTIAKWFSTNFKCQTYFYDENDTTKKLLTTVRRPRFDVTFFKPKKTENPWPGVILRFQGQLASKFYSLYKSTDISFDKLTRFNISLGRIDICYDRTLKTKDPSVLEFLKRTKEQNFKIAELGKNGLVVKVWKRKGGLKHYRAYLRDNGKDLRFELELKRENAKQYQYSLFRRDFYEFEQAQIRNFFQTTNQIFNLDEPLMDWCQKSVRFVQKPFSDLKPTFSTGYLTPNLMSLIGDELKFYKILQVMDFLKTQECLVQTLGYEYDVYRSYRFQVNDLLTYLGEDRTNYYKLQNFVTFFQDLEDLCKNKLPTLEIYYSKNCYRRVALMPIFYVKQVGKKKIWQVSLTVSEEFELMVYYSPFNLSSLFSTYENINDLRAKVFVIQALTQPSTQKQLNTQIYFQQLDLTKHQMLAIKKYIVSLLLKLAEDKLIKPSCQLYGNQTMKTKHINDLTINALTRAEYLTFEEIIDV